MSAQKKKKKKKKKKKRKKKKKKKKRRTTTTTYYRVSEWYNNYRFRHQYRIGNGVALLIHSVRSRCNTESSECARRTNNIINSKKVKYKKMCATRQNFFFNRLIIITAGQ